LEEIDYERIYIDWSSIKDIVKHLDNRIYLSLIDAYKDRGFFEDADKCYFYYRNKLRPEVYKDLSNWPNIFYRFFDWILEKSYGYGVRPLQPLAVFVILSFLAFGLLYIVSPELVGFSNNTSHIDAASINLQVFLSGTKLVDNPNYPAHGRLLWIFAIEKVLAALFFAMFVISFGRTIIR
jgi:hypothetical protein